jgi:hypothetical protein
MYTAPPTNIRNSPPQQWHPVFRTRPSLAHETDRDGTHVTPALDLLDAASSTPASMAVIKIISAQRVSARTHLNKFQTLHARLRQASLCVPSRWPVFPVTGAAANRYLAVVLGAQLETSHQLTWIGRNNLHSTAVYMNNCPVETLRAPGQMCRF